MIRRNNHKNKHLNVRKIRKFLFEKLSSVYVCMYVCSYSEHFEFFIVCWIEFIMYHNFYKIMNVS